MVLIALSSSFKLTNMHKNHSEISMLPISLKNLFRKCGK